ncbi:MULTISPECIES: replication initiation factor family protein [Bacillales]|uniref:replication initiation factor family protein n=1 Tax=Bacillales TaxID=1385 RepID=UPI001E537C47|nr:replication initiation factor family protein [Metabacillus sp. B2-18]UGB30953.1 replication initiation factor family protein [Metabacillus sp. B2-18]
MLASVKLDKLVLEYVNIPLNIFDAIKDDWNISDIKSNEGFHYHRCLQITKNDTYIKLYYQSKYEIWKPVGKLRLETQPEYLCEFSSLLKKLKEISRDVYFVSMDVAFDFPIHQSNLLVTSNTGREMNLFQGTRYFGGKGQRGKNGYCRIYDKKQELLNREVIKGELTRVEIVYKSKLVLADLANHPPSFNKYYSGWIVDKDIKVPPIYKAIIICLQKGDMTINEFSRHYRRVIKNLFKDQTIIDFDEHIRKLWIDQVSNINRFVV